MQGSSSAVLCGGMYAQKEAYKPTVFVGLVSLCPRDVHAPKGPHPGPVFLPLFIASPVISRIKCSLQSLCGRAKEFMYVCLHQLMGVCVILLY